MNAITCKLAVVVAQCAAFAVAPAWAQHAMQAMDMSHHQQSAKQPTKPNPKQPAASKKTHAHQPAAHSMHGTSTPAPPATAQRQHSGVNGGAVPGNARSADYSDGIGYGSMPGMHMLGNTALGKWMVDRLEYASGRHGHGVTLDAEAWYGTDANKLWLKTEGERESGRLQNLRFEALWDRPVSAYWDAQLGLRHDFGVGPDRTWAAFGVQGFTPYWFDVEATFYVGQAGRTALRFESEYELLLTQRLILQPHFEINAYGRDDPQRGIGSGLSDAELGLRLRYEFTRQFAPYVGVAWTRQFRRTADFARAAGEHVFDASLVAGLRLWF